MSKHVFDVIFPISMMCMENPKTMHLHREVPTLRKNVLPPSSGQKKDEGTIWFRNSRIHPPAYTQ
jgi:hypothetical protein